MDDRLRVHHDLDLLGRQSEQQMGLDEFQALVHHDDGHVVGAWRRLGGGGQ